MSASATLDDLKKLPSRNASRGTDPPRPASDGADLPKRSGPDRAGHLTDALPLDPAAARQRSQLPAFAPLLEELEIAGWSSHRAALSGNFHDWLLLEGRMILVAVGQAVAASPAESTEAALVAQAVWASIRAHARHVHDAGLLLSLVAQTLWPTPSAMLQASAAVAIVDTAEGHATLAMAGDSLAWRIRAAASEQLSVRQPPLGGAADCTYLAQSIQLSLRERLVLVADDPQRRSPKLPASIASTFARLDAETHRHMLAADAVTLVRRHYEHGAADSRSPASVAAVRRR
jgi:hypothetical protein